MKEYLSLLEYIYPIHELGTKSEESWSYLTIEGTYSKSLIGFLRAYYSFLDKINCSNSLSIKIESETITFNELEDYESVDNSFSSWSVSINKELLIQRKFFNNFNINFFLSEDACCKWFVCQDPISKNNKINALSPLRIIVKDLDILIGGEYFCFIPAIEDFLSTEIKNNIVLPEEGKIKESVYFITNSEIKFNPNTYVAAKDFSSNKPIAQAWLRQSILALSSCVVNEFYSFDKIILDGLKRSVLKVSEENDSFSIKLQQNLCQLILWIYEDRATTRKKLFNDRLTLEYQNGDSLIESLNKHLLGSLEQAKQRYNFIIIERKDAYVKELKDLLKDLRNQSDLYAQKIRTLLSNFLRDLLAAIILIGFTIFTKFTENIGLMKHELLEYVFHGLAIYYIISVLLQIILDWTDIYITKTELRYWKNASKELIADSEFNQHLKESLKKRKWSLRILYPIISSLYIVLAYACYKYPRFFVDLIDSSK